MIGVLLDTFFCSVGASTRFWDPCGVFFDVFETSGELIKRQMGYLGTKFLPEMIMIGRREHRVRAPSGEGLGGDGAGAVVRRL